MSWERLPVLAFIALIVLIVLLLGAPQLFNGLR